MDNCPTSLLLHNKPCHNLVAYVQPVVLFAHEFVGQHLAGGSVGQVLLFIAS